MSTPRVDWSDGDYSRTAAMLAPAAEVTLDRVGLRPGEHLLDVACGTGNAVLTAAARGAAATGVDLAEGLLVIARRRAEEAGAASATFLAGDAQSLPVADGAFDAVVSVFGVIFAPDPARGLAEMRRAAGREGRVALSAWIPRGPVSEAVALLRRTMHGAAPPPPASPALHEPEVLSGLLGGPGLEVSVTEHELVMTAGSAAEKVDDEAAHHPMWRAVVRALPDDRWQALREQVVAVLEAGNEDPHGFRVTMRYVVAVAAPAR